MKVTQIKQKIEFNKNILVLILKSNRENYVQNQQRHPTHTLSLSGMDRVLDI